MYRIILVLATIFSFKMGCTQEAALNDLNRCQIYSFKFDIKKQLVKLLLKAKDTINYYYDQQIIILYNEKEHKGLNANTFYIINHGFKRKVTIDMMFAEIENTGKKIENLSDTTKFDTFINWHFENDTIYCDSYASSLLTLPFGFYKKFKINSCLLRISYTDKVVYKWLFRNDEFKLSQKTI